VFVTWRLADSLPQAELNQLRTEQEIWNELHAGVGEKQSGAEYRRRFSRHVDDWLDQGFGSCLLREAAMAKIVGDALRHFHGAWYELDSFVVMPNHVHVLFRPLGKHLLAAILKSWKGFTGRALNKRTGQKGAVWQDEYWDRLIRDDRHFSRTVEYIRANPIKANLREGQFLLESGLSSPLF
jgi:type I restriction enzyme R subunit